jgi:hypothetical protein
MTAKTPTYIDRWTYLVYVIADDTDSPPLGIYLDKTEAEHDMCHLPGDAVLLEYHLDSTKYLHLLSTDTVTHLIYHCRCTDKHYFDRRLCQTCGAVAGVSTKEDHDGR